MTDRPRAPDSGPADEAPLRLALQHAPDHDQRPPPALRQALRAAARQAAAQAAARPPAVAPPRPAGQQPQARRGAAGRAVQAWWDWWDWLLQPTTLGAVASVAVLGLAVHLWWAVQGAGPDAAEAASAAAPVAAADAARSAPAAPGESPEAPQRKRATSPVAADRATSPEAAPMAPAHATVTASDIAQHSPPADASPARVEASGSSIAISAPEPMDRRARWRALAAEVPSAVPPEALGEAGAKPAASDLAQAQSKAQAQRQDWTQAAAQRSAPPARPAPLQRLADALAHDGLAAGWTVAVPGAEPRSLDPSAGQAWRRWMAQTDGHWTDEPPPRAAALVQAPDLAAAVWRLAAPDGARFELSLQADTVLLWQPPTGAGPLRVWRATRPGGWTAPPR